MSIKRQGIAGPLAAVWSGNRYRDRSRAWWHIRKGPGFNMPLRMCFQDVQDELLGPLEAAPFGSGENLARFRAAVVRMKQIRDKVKI